MLSSRSAKIPPQVCSLALGCNGFAGLLSTWTKLGIDHLTAPSSVFASAAVFFVVVYVIKLLASPGAVLKDVGDPHTLVAISALPAVSQGLAVRFQAMFPLVVVQTVVILGWFTSIMISVRFLMLNYKSGSMPDPTWFPACLISSFAGMCNYHVGPEAFHDLFQYQFLFLMTAVYWPLLAIVTYRLFYSKVRDSVTPHAGMALLMAPSSFSSFVHSNSGKPFGDGVGLALIIMSTGFFFLTCRLLYRRRNCWAFGFQASYVAFTFPLTATASAALLASERLPAIPSPLFRYWAAVLTTASFFITTGVVVRFCIFLFATVGSSTAQKGSTTTKNKNVKIEKPKQENKSEAKANGTGKQHRKKKQ